MPTLPASPIEENVALRSQGLGAYPSSSSEVLGATAEEAWVTNPIPSLWQTMKANPIHRERVLAPFLPEPKTITPEEANQKYGIEGELKFDEPIFDDVAQDYHKMKRDELARRDIYQRSKGGALLSTAQFGVGLGVSIVDPLNIASAFIPVVGSTRYALMLERAGTAAGRAGVRTAVGAAEGLVGAAVVEPLIYTAATQRQADYDATDSLLNLAFGTVLGGGLHAGLGALGDAIRAKKLEEPLLREGVASVIEDRPVTVDANLRAAMADRPAPIGEAIPGEPTVARAARGEPVAEIIAPEGVVQKFETPVAFSEAVISKIKDIYPDTEFTINPWQNDAGKSAYIEMVGGPTLRISDHGIGAKRFGAEGGWIDYRNDDVGRAVDFFKSNIQKEVAVRDILKTEIQNEKYMIDARDTVSVKKFGTPYAELSGRDKKWIDNNRKNEIKNIASENARRASYEKLSSRSFSDDASSEINKQISEAYAPGVKPWDAPSVKAVDEIVERAPRDNISDETRAIQEEIALYETLAGTLDDAEAAFIKEADDMNTFADQFSAATEAVARCRIGRS